MMYVVEIGGVEVFVELIVKGHKAYDLDPIFEVTANCDWEGVPIDITDQEEEEAILWVIRNYEHEVYI